ncbi:MBL fold metallo-hydrolase, partial [Phaeodactylibacter xiamenensis]|uniref:MBL fold metallo-hydrolase n=1 Tax=Phaeodactylibacter xiamenensis TaxID=1524460 RepID=UPI0024A876BD
TITKKLIIGSILFGIGWGITGMCPSTFPIRLGIGDPSAYIALIALFFGYHSEFIFENLTFVNSNHEYLILHQFFDPPSSSFTYIVGDKFTNNVVIIDSVYNEKNYEIPTTKLIGNLYYIEHDVPTHEALIKFCDIMNYNIKFLLNTHIHVDHITANDKIKQIRYIPSIIGSYSGSTKSDFKYDTTKKIFISDYLSLEAFKTPGHTKDCHSLLLKTDNDSYLFSGDVLLITGVGRTDLDNSESIEDYKTNKEILFNSLLTIIDKINDKSTTIYPAHDYTERKYTTYDEILKINPYMILAYKYYKSKDEKYKTEFIETFTKKEKSLAHFDEYDINLCVDINKMCGIVDDISYEKLDQLWSKSSGACG